MLTNSVLKRRVLRGMRVLDEKYPGWDAEVDVKTLNIMNGVRCVLGQLYGYYGRGADSIGLTEAKLETHGFVLYSQAGYYSTLEDYKRLQQCWEEALLYRKEAYAHTA